MRVSSSMRRFALPGALAVMAGAAVVLAGTSYFRHRPAKLLLAPMIGLDICLATSAHSTLGAPANAELAQSCSGPQGSAAALVESTLAALQPPGSNASGYELGYTLNVPLLTLFKEQRRRLGDRQGVAGTRGAHPARYRASGHPVPLFHALRPETRRSKPRSRPTRPTSAGHPQGPLPKDTFYGADIYNWSLASTRTAITARRVQAAQAVLREICKLEPRHIREDQGHHLAGGTAPPVPQLTRRAWASRRLIWCSDYSDVSKAGFRKFLEELFRHHRQPERHHRHQLDLVSTQVEPPSKDMRTTPLRDFTEHIDSFAHGIAADFRMGVRSGSDRPRAAPWCGSTATAI